MSNWWLGAQENGPPPPAPPAAEQTAEPAAIAALRAQFSWVFTMGIEPSKLQEWAATFVTGDQLVQAVRQTPQWQTMFQGIRRPDGTLRMDEGSYLARRSEYQKLLRQFGDGQYGYDNPTDTAWVFENDMDPNELKERLETYQQIRDGSQDQKDAFYVYAGMEVSDDDLYNAVVKPEYADALKSGYNQRIAASPLDYQTWITRATEVGLRRVSQTLKQLEGFGTSTGATIGALQQVDPEFARQMMDALYHGGNPGNTQTLALNELTRAFEYAAIGAAASSNGFTMPDLDRVEALRQAGVDRAKAMQGYSTLAQKGNSLAGAVQRANRGSGFTQDDFERAVLLQQGDAARILQKAQSAEEAFGAQQGSAIFSNNNAGQTQQRGLKSTFS